MFTLNQNRFDGVSSVAFKTAVDSTKVLLAKKKSCLVKTEGKRVECTHYCIMNSTEEIDEDNRLVFL